MLPVSHLAGCRTKQQPHSKAHTAARLVSPSRAGPIETHTLVFFLALLLLPCCCITHGPPGSVYVAVTVQRQPRCKLSYVTATDGAYVRMCKFCTWYQVAASSCKRAKITTTRPPGSSNAGARRLPYAAIHNTLTYYSSDSSGVVSDSARLSEKNKDGHLPRHDGVV